MSDQVILTGVDPFSECLCVIPEHAVKADLAFIAALTESTTFGQVRSNSLAWLEVTGHERRRRGSLQKIEPASRRCSQTWAGPSESPTN